MVQPHLEPGFDEEPGGVLFLDFHRYLTLMSRASDPTVWQRHTGYTWRPGKLSVWAPALTANTGSRRRIRLRDGASHRV